MLFQDANNPEVGIEIGVGRVRLPLTGEEKLRLRDGALWILNKAGLTFTEILEVIKAIVNEPIYDRSHVRNRILSAEGRAVREAARREAISSPRA